MTDHADLYSCLSATTRAEDRMHRGNTPLLHFDQTERVAWERGTVEKQYTLDAETRWSRFTFFLQSAQLPFPNQYENTLAAERKQQVKKKIW